jgi:hypothetical protein
MSMSWNWQFSEIPIPELQYRVERGPRQDCLKSFKIIQFKIKPPKDKGKAALKLEKRSLPPLAEDATGEQARVQEVEGSHLLLIEGLVPQEKYLVRSEAREAREGKDAKQTARVRNSFSVNPPPAPLLKTIYAPPDRSYLDPREQEFLRVLTRYRDFLWRVNYSNQIRVPPSEPRTLKAFLGKGNNSKLIRAVLRKRWWWTVTEEYDRAVNFVWTQIKLEDYYHAQGNAD